ncbi:MAG: hypothetical protein ABJV04_04850 [Aliiglaciecola sp.]|uniref:hypothetical protein n=1 Tax=Aliiglaciecola sp. TaxID=1872441 RepID=UPI0032980DF3
MRELVKTFVVLSSLILCACSSPYTVVTTEQLVEQDDQVMLLDGIKVAYLISSEKVALSNFSGENSRYIDTNTAIDIVENGGVTIFDAPLYITNLADCYKIDYRPSSNSSQGSEKDTTYFVKFSKTNVPKLYILNLLESCSSNDSETREFSYMSVVLENDIATFSTFSERALDKLTWNWYNSLNVVQRFWFGVSKNDSNDEDEIKQRPLIFENARGLEAVMEYVYYHQHASSLVKVQLGEGTDEQRTLFNKYARANQRKKANQ